MIARRVMMPMHAQDTTTNTAAFTIPRNHPLAPVRLEAGSMGPGMIRSPRTGAARRLRAAACVALAGAALLSVAAQAQSATNLGATADAQVAMLTQGSIEKIADMDFGTIAQPSAAGTVVLTPQIAATCTASATLVRTGLCRAARFALYQKNNKHVFIGEDNNGSITLTGPGGATMQVTNLTMDVSGLAPKQGSGGGWNFGKWQINGVNDFAEFYVGGTLHVGTAQAPGSYTGTLLIEVNMN
jgi:hypothetical protein